MTVFKNNVHFIKRYHDVMSNIQNFCIQSKFFACILLLNANFSILHESCAFVYELKSEHKNNNAMLVRVLSEHEQSSYEANPAVID